MSKAHHFKRLALPVLIATLLASPAVPVCAAETTDDEDKQDSNNKMVVVGAKIEQDLADVAGSVSVMSSAEIEEQAVSDMSDLFRYEPGIEISGSSGTAQNFIIRGMGADRVMMIKDGMRMNEGYGKDGTNNIVGRGFIDVDTIKQVEVAKGASSSLFGADALGGVVVFTTKDPEDYLDSEDFYLKLNTSFDSRNNQHSTGFTSAFVSGSLKHMLNYKKRDADETKNYKDTNRDLAIESDSILYKSTYSIDQQQNIKLSIDSFKQDIIRPDNGSDKGNYLELPGWSINSELSTDKQENTSYSLEYHHAKTDTLLFDSLDITLYKNETEQVSTSRINHDTMDFSTGEMGNRDKISDLLFTQDTKGLSIALFKQLEMGSVSHAISYGIDFDSSETQRPKHEIRIQNGVEIMNTLSAPFPENKTQRMGIYIQDQIETGNFQLIPGVRFDDYEMTPDKTDPLYLAEAVDGATVEEISKSHISPRIGAIYKLNDSLNLYAQYSSGFKVPPYDLAYISHENLYAGYEVIPANKSLKPEESDSYEIGLRGSFEQLNFTLSRYKNEYTNMIEATYYGNKIVNTPYGEMALDIFQYQNIDAATVKGTELSVQYAVNDFWQLSLSANQMNAKNDETGDYLSSMRPLSGTLGVSYSNNQNYSMDLITSYASGMTRNNEGTHTTSGYAVADFLFNYQVSDNTKVNLTIFNLFDREYTRYSKVAGIEEDDRDWSSYTEAGQSFSLRLDYEF